MKKADIEMMKLECRRLPIMGITNTYQHLYLSIDDQLVMLGL